MSENGETEKGTSELRPLISYFLATYPYGPDDHDFPAGTEFCEIRQLSVLPDGAPVYASRSKSPPTSTMTPGHTLPAGYTRAGNWKPAKYMPAKMDKRAGR